MLQKQYLERGQKLNSWRSKKCRGSSLTFEPYCPLCHTLTRPFSNSGWCTELQIFPVSPSNLHSFFLPSLKSIPTSLLIRTHKEAPIRSSLSTSIYCQCCSHTYVLILQLDHKLLEHMGCVLYKSMYPPQFLEDVQQILGSWLW